MTPQKPRRTDTCDVLIKEFPKALRARLRIMAAEQRLATGTERPFMRDIFVRALAKGLGITGYESWSSESQPHGRNGGTVPRRGRPRQN
jgi:hypothetical protein